MPSVPCSWPAPKPVALWHADADLHGVDAVVLPGGFSYGDYLRAGAIARFSPVVDAVIEAARGGLPVLGICNGFQILCESGLLPGALTRNAGMRFVCRDQQLRVGMPGRSGPAAYEPGSTVVIPVKHGDGRYVAQPQNDHRAGSAGPDRHALRRGQCERLAGGHRRGVLRPTGGSSA